MICEPCGAGDHQHDRHTGAVPGTRAGADAGCPHMVGGEQCACIVNLTPHLTAATDEPGVASIPIVVYSDHGDDKDPVLLPITSVDLDGDHVWVYVLVPEPDEPEPPAEPSMSVVESLAEWFEQNLTFEAYTQMTDRDLATLFATDWLAVNTALRVESAEQGERPDGIRRISQWPIQREDVFPSDG